MPQKIGNLRPSVWPTETNMCEKVTTVTNWNDPHYVCENDREGKGGGRGEGEKGGRREGGSI